MLNKMEHELKNLDFRVERINEQIEHEMDVLESIINSRDEYDIVTFMEAKIEKIKELRNERLGIEHNMKMIKYFRGDL